MVVGIEVVPGSLIQPSLIWCGKGSGIGRTLLYFTCLEQAQTTSSMPKLIAEGLSPSEFEVEKRATSSTTMTSLESVERTKKEETSVFRV